MNNLQTIADQIRRNLSDISDARDAALKDARSLTRACSLAIRAIHRGDQEEIDSNLEEARLRVAGLRNLLENNPALYYSGYTQDAFKEYVEAKLTYAIIQKKPLITPKDLGVEDAAYLNGLAEVVGELRRRTLDILRQGYSQEVVDLLDYMDEIYSVLILMDFPDAVTNGLRRQTDLAHSLVEKTRGDVIESWRGDRVAGLMKRYLKENGIDVEDN